MNVYLNQYPLTKMELVKKYFDEIQKNKKLKEENEKLKELLLQYKNAGF